MDSDILLIDKPKGITSFDVIRKLRKKLGIKKMGHAGTLDPLATGLMIIGIESGTKKMTQFLKLSKVYVAEILLGTQTDTGDLEGKIIEEKEIPELNEEKIKKALNEMNGKLEIQVPLYSAIKRGGKPLYKYARKGEKVEVPIKTMEVISTNLLKQEKNILTIEFEVGSGTYIRSLAEELGKRLGTVATLQNLRRTKIGDFSIEDAEKI